MNAWEIVGFD